MSNFVLNTARKIKAVTRSKIQPEMTILSFEKGKNEEYLKWFVEKYKPEPGKIVVKDNEGFTRVVTESELYAN